MTGQLSWLLHACAGLMTDKPAVEAWLVCTEAVSLPVHCLNVNFLTERPVNGSFYPEFSTNTASTFRYVVNYKGDDPLAQAEQFNRAFVTMDLEASR